MCVCVWERISTENVTQKTRRLRYFTMVWRQWQFLYRNHVSDIFFLCCYLRSVTCLYVNLVECLCVRVEKKWNEHYFANFKVEPFVEQTLQLRGDVWLFSLFNILMSCFNNHEQIQNNLLDSINVLDLL